MSVAPCLWQDGPLAFGMAGQCWGLEDRNLTSSRASNHPVLGAERFRIG